MCADKRSGMQCNKALDDGDVKVLCGPASELATSFFNDHIVEDRPIGEQPGECRMELELNKLGPGKMELGLDRKELGPAGRKELGQHTIVVEELHSWTWAS